MRKKAAQAIPNQLLRRARLERGWTQKVVAERIGAPNEVIVTRWESGAAFPSAYYIERLCLLFEQRASDLGLLKETFPSGNPTNSASQQSHLKDSRNHLIQTIAAITAKHLPPVIGRETEIETLQQIYRCVQQGRTQIVLIQGEAGIGKTLLASAFLQWADAQGATLLQGRAFEMGGRIPYQPLVHALNHRVEAEQRLETQLDTIWLSELSRILPSYVSAIHFYQW